MFKGDMTVQQRKLMDTLAVAVGALHDMPALTMVLADLGRRHQGYGVLPENYKPVGEALLWTLQTVLGRSFGDEARQTWTALYAAVTHAMTSPSRKTSTDGSEPETRGSRPWPKQRAAMTGS